MPQDSFMRLEINEIPKAAGRLSAPATQAELRRLGAHLAALDPAAIVTLARGSSDHAAHVLAYAIGMLTGRPVASSGPSLASVFAAPLRARGLAAIAISQSGQSMDLTAATRAYREAGAWTLALTNTPAAPMAREAHAILDIAAGREGAVAATKSYVSSVIAGLWVLGHWTADPGLLAALEALPERLEQALSVDYQALAEDLAQIERLFVIGRGPTLGIAGEVALKAMELCGVHASAYSAAEVLHGPSAVLTQGFAVLSVGAPEAAQLSGTLEKIASQGARVIAAPTTSRQHDLTDGLVALVPIYAALEAAARARGRDPDRPKFLKKETLTL